MKATYTGLDGVLNYTTGEEYELVEEKDDLVRWGNVYKIICRKTGGGVNVYSSKKMFEKDWKICL